MKKTPNPQETAKSMINDRIVTEEMAKKSSIDWIESGIEKGGFPSEVIAFWKEVLTSLKE